MSQLEDEANVSVLCCRGARSAAPLRRLRQSSCYSLDSRPGARDPARRRSVEAHLRRLVKRGQSVVHPHELRRPRPEPRSRWREVGRGAHGTYTQNSKLSSISAKPAADPLGVTWGSWQYSNRPTTRHPAGSSSTHLRRVVAAVSRGVCVATPRDGRMRAIARRTSAHENLQRSRSISRSPDVHEIVLVGERIELTRVDSQRVSHRGVGAVDERKDLVDLAARQGDGERVRPHDQRHDVWP